MKTFVSVFITMIGVSTSAFGDYHCAVTSSAIAAGQDLRFDVPTPPEPTIVERTIYDNVIVQCKHQSPVLTCGFFEVEEDDVGSPILFPIGSGIAVDGSGDFYLMVRDGLYDHSLHCTLDQ